MQYSLRNIFKWILYAAFLLPAIWKMATNFNLYSAFIGFAFATLLLPFFLLPNLIDYLLGNDRSSK